MIWMMTVMILPILMMWIMTMMMILQDSDAPVALGVVTGSVKERDSDHGHRRGDCQRGDPPELK